PPPQDELRARTWGGHRRTSSSAANSAAAPSWSSPSPSAAGGAPRPSSRPRHTPPNPLWVVPGVPPDWSNLGADAARPTTLSLGLSSFCCSISPPLSRTPFPHSSPPPLS
ncbi:unnamed protein product, partial [Ectocarpus sp. 12 AP-2014]